VDQHEVSRPGVYQAGIDGLPPPPGKDFSPPVLVDGRYLGYSAFVRAGDAHLLRARRLGTRLEPAGVLEDADVVHAYIVHGTSAKRVHAFNVGRPSLLTAGSLLGGRDVAGSAALVG